MAAVYTELPDHLEDEERVDGLAAESSKRQQSDVATDWNRRLHSLLAPRRRPALAVSRPRDQPGAGVEVVCVAMVVEAVLLLPLSLVLAATHVDRLSFGLGNFRIGLLVACSLVHYVWSAILLCVAGCNYYRARSWSRPGLAYELAKTATVLWTLVLVCWTACTVVGLAQLWLAQPLGVCTPLDLGDPNVYFVAAGQGALAVVVVPLAYWILLETCLCCS